MDDFSRAGMVFDVTDTGPADGEVVVLLHGYPENRTSWQGVAPGLAEGGFRVLAPDQRGYSPGARPPRRRDYVMPELVADTLALVDAAGAERAHVVGHDWGGGVAWAFASAHPDRCATVTSLTTPHPRAMLSAMWRGQLLKSWYMLAFQLPYLPELAFRPQNEPWLRGVLERTGLPPEAVDRYVRPLQQPGAATAALNWYRALPLVPPGDDGPVRVPALYVYATGDRFLGRAAADRTARYVDAPYRYEVLEGASHWLPEERPETVVQLVTEHARAHPAR